MIKVLATAGRTIAAKLAGYIGRQQVVVARSLGVQAIITSVQAGAMPDTAILRHYVRIRDGVLARTWVGSTYVEVAVVRKGNKRATFQGYVEAVDGGWRALDPDGNLVHEATGPDVSYLDVEAHLVKLRTGRRSHAELIWPRAMIADLGPLPGGMARSGLRLAG